MLYKCNQGRERVGIIAISQKGLGNVHRGTSNDERRKVHSVVPDMLTCAGDLLICLVPKNDE